MVYLYFENINIQFLIDLQTQVIENLSTRRRNKEVIVVLFVFGNRLINCFITLFIVSRLTFSRINNRNSFEISSPIHVPDFLIARGRKQGVGREETGKKK